MIKHNDLKISFQPDKVSKVSLCYYDPDDGQAFSKTFYSTLQNLTHSHNLKDETGKSIPTIKVLSMSIRYLKGHLLNALRMRGKDVGTDDIKWMITVPAFWSDATKQFMRMAAVQVCYQEWILVFKSITFQRRFSIMLKL